MRLAQGKMPNISHVPQEIDFSLTKSAMKPFFNETLRITMPMTAMKSLDGFSDLQLGRYCFNLETEFLPKGFETLVSSSQAFSKIQFLFNTQ